MEFQGSFATGKKVPISFGRDPALHISGIGRISYPLLPVQARSIIEVATQAPFGKGRETVVDLSIRKTWQVERSQVTINKEWMNNALPQIVKQCCDAFGLDSMYLGVEAHLYKLLLYEVGGHFKKHKDTEKEPGMFGSLLIQLPSLFEGGKLLVQHRTDQKVFDFSLDSEDACFYTAFYADCDHEVEPITNGYRLVLAFNLVRTGELHRPLPTPDAAMDYEQCIQKAVRSWCADVEASFDVPTKFAYLMEHQYTTTNLCFEGLKGKDKMLLDLLKSLKYENGHPMFVVHVALITKHVTGTEEESYGYGGSGNMCKDADIEEDVSVTHWVGEFGAVPGLNGLNVDIAAELLMEGFGSDEDEADQKTEKMFGDNPDEEESEGYQGNYAGTLEYWYHSSIVVFWPTGLDFRVKLPIDFTGALNSTLRRKNTVSDSSYEDEVRALVHYASKHPQKVREADTLAALLRMTRLDPRLAEIVLDSICATIGIPSASVATELCNAARSMGWDAAKSGITQLLQHAAAKRPEQLDHTLAFLEMLEHELSGGGKDDEQSDTNQSSYEDTLCMFANAVLQSGSLKKSKKEEVAKLLELLMSKECCSEASFRFTNIAVFGLALGTLNYLIPKLAPLFYSANSTTNPVMEALKACAIGKLVSNKSKVPESEYPDLVSMLEWMLKLQDLASLEKVQKALIDNQSSSLYTLVFAPDSNVTKSLLNDKNTPCHHILENILRHRIEFLQKHSTPPSNTWCFEKASVPNHPEFQTFLRGPSRSFVVTGFNGIADARRFSSQHQRCRSSDFVYRPIYGSATKNGPGNEYSVRCIPSGIGRNAKVKVEKTSAVHEKKVKKCQENAEELQMLKAFMETISGPLSSFPTTQLQEQSNDAPPTTKRLKTEEVAGTKALSREESSTTHDVAIVAPPVRKKIAAVIDLEADNQASCATTEQLERPNGKEETKKLKKDWSAEVAQLIDMGFSNESQLIPLLEKHWKKSSNSVDLQHVISELFG